jgi:hypothetical protein
MERSNSLNRWRLRLKLKIFVCVLALVTPSLAPATDGPALTVTTQSANLYVNQDSEGKIVSTLARGEVLKPLAQGVGGATWYMVKTAKGLIGWIQAVDVASTERTDEVFRDQSKIKAPNRFVGSLDQCLARADEAHQNTWSKTCERSRREADCPLVGADADVLKRDHRAAREECIKLYGVTKFERAP